MIFVTASTVVASRTSPNMLNLIGFIVKGPAVECIISVKLIDIYKLNAPAVQLGPDQRKLCDVE